ncbi:MAG: Hpt domain-containing protein [Desulfonatronovibrio sp.]
MEHGAEDRGQRAWGMEQRSESEIGYRTSEGASQQGRGLPVAGRGLPVASPSSQLDRVGEDKEVMREILENVLKDAPDRLESLKKAVEARNLQEVHSLAHSIKGMAGNISAPRVRETAFKLETLGANQELSGMEELISELENEFALLQKALQDTLQV